MAAAHVSACFQVTPGAVGSFGGSSPVLASHALVIRLRVTMPALMAAAVVATLCAVSCAVSVPASADMAVVRTSFCNKVAPSLDSD